MNPKEMFPYLKPDLAWFEKLAKDIKIYEKYCSLRQEITGFLGDEFLALPSDYKKRVLTDIDSIFRYIDTQKRREEENEPE